MWNREAAIFAAYATVIVSGLTAILSLLMGRPSSPGGINANVMAPITFIVVITVATIYLRNHRLGRDSRGAALGALSAFTLYCTMVFCLMAVFYSSVQQWIEQGKTGHVPGATGFYAIVLSPVLMPLVLLIGAGCGIVYIRLKHILGYTANAAPVSGTRRRRHIGMVLALTAMVVIAIPTMIILGGLPALMILGNIGPLQNSTLP